MTYANKGKSMISFYEMNLNDAFYAIPMFIYVSIVDEICNTMATFLLQETQQSEATFD